MTIQAIENWVENNKTEIFAFLEKIVNINSFSENDTGLIQTADLIVDWGRLHGFEFKKIKNNNNSNIFHLYLEGRSQTPYFALVGHFDTVHSPESHFNGLVNEGNKLIGPGVLDMKSGLVVVLYALAVLKELEGSTNLPFRVILNCDEETGSLDSRTIIEEKLVNATGAFIFEGRYESDNAIVTARKGIIMCEVDVFGHAAHAGESPEEGANAVVEMAEKIVLLQRLTDFSSGTTVSPGMVKGGVTANTIPDHCHAEIDIRFPNLAAGDKVRRDIINILETRFGPGTRTEYKLTDARPAFVRTVKSEQLRDFYFDTAREFAISVGEESRGGGSDGNLTSAMGIPTLDSLGPAGDHPHTDKEYIVKKSLFECIKVTALFLSRLIHSRYR